MPTMTQKSKSVWCATLRSIRGRAWSRVVVGQEHTVCQFGGPENPARVAFQLGENLHHHQVTIYRLSYLNLKCGAHCVVFCNAPTYIGSPNAKTRNPLKGLPEDSYVTANRKPEICKPISFPPYIPRRVAGSRITGSSLVITPYFVGMDFATGRR